MLLGRGGVWWPCLGRQGYSVLLKGFWPLGNRSIFI
jgi:hypothetical protein